MDYKITGYEPEKLFHFFENFCKIYIKFKQIFHVIFN